MALLRRLLRDEDGPTAVEYAVMLAMVMLACIGAVALMGQATADSWANSGDEIDRAMNP